MAITATASRTLEALPGRYMTHGMNIYTLLDDAVRGFGGAAEEGCIGGSDRQRPVTGLHDAGGECRCLFGVGVGPTELGAGAKQETEVLPVVQTKFLIL
jgi:hypothetical protein